MYNGKRTTHRRRRIHGGLVGRGDWGRELLEALQRAGRLPLLAGLFVAGMVLGRGMVGILGGSTGEQALALAGGFLAQRSVQTPLQTFLVSFFSSGGQLLLLLFLGFCAIGTPLLYLYPLVRGMGVGLGYGSLFYQEGVRALGWFAVLLPNLLLSTIILLTACRLSIDLSLKFWTFTGRKEGPTARIAPSGICSRYIFFTLLLVLSSGLDALLLAIFGRFLSI